MPRFLRRIYVAELPRLVGLARLRMAEAAMVPHMNEEQRAETLARIRIQAAIPESVPQKLTPEQYLGRVAAHGIGVRHAPRRKDNATPRKSNPGGGP